MANPNDDKQLLNRIRQSDEAAFETLFNRYFPRLKSYAQRFVETEDAAKDIVQDCFVKIWEKRDALEVNAVSGLLITMVRNRCINHIRRSGIIAKYQSSEQQISCGEERLYYFDFLNNTEQQVIGKEIEEQIEMILKTLSPRCREVFIKSRFEGLKNREIALELKISTTAVEKHISKALGVFAVHFKRKYPTNLYAAIIGWLATIS